MEEERERERGLFLRKKRGKSTTSYLLTDQFSHFQPLTLPVLPLANLEEKKNKKKKQKEKGGKEYSINLT